MDDEGDAEHRRRTVGDSGLALKDDLHQAVMRADTIKTSSSRKSKILVMKLVVDTVIMPPLSRPRYSPLFMPPEV